MATPTGHPGPASPLLTTRLSAMMFLEFFIWGAWYVTLAPYMTAMGMGAGIGDAYTVGPLAAIISPFFLGMVADRFFASERVLGVLQFVGGLALLAAPAVAEAFPLHAVTQDGRVVQVREHLPFVGVLLVHMLCFMPTLGLTNSLAFHHLTNQEKQFPLIRVLGTIGWIAAGWVVGLAMGSVPEGGRALSPLFFSIAGAAGLVMGVYSFFLPHTPPPAAGKATSARDVLGLDTLALLKDRSFAAFILGSFLICIPLAAYYAFAGVYVGATGTLAADVPTRMAYGQMSELLFMLVMPLCFARLGVKWMLAAGMLAWAVRYGLFAGAWSGPGGTHIQWMVLAGIMLHGICYDFFFVAGQIYVDQRAPRDLRGQAQGFLVLVTQGLGLGIGAQAFQRLVVNPNTVGGVTDWRTVWAVPSAFAAVVLLAFVALFRAPKREPA
jgi:nucleoside transporter